MKKVLINLNQKKAEKIIFDKSGTYVVFFENLSGEFQFIIKEKDIDLEIFAIYRGKNHDRFHLSTIQHHLAPASKSNLLVKGVFADYSQFIYQGLIRIEKNAQKSNAYQKNQNLLLSSNTFVDSKPQLEILANDVICTHSSTTGQINQDEIYYLQTRGLTSDQTKSLIIEGFLSDVYGRINRFGH